MAEIGERDGKGVKVGVVGACATGKSTLVSALSQEGYDAHHIAQEHSFVGDMWRKIGRPDVLIYLDASYEAITGRRPNSGLKRGDLDEQIQRLRHARSHCDLYLDTTDLNPKEVQIRVLAYLRDLEP